MLHAKLMPRLRKIEGPDDYPHSRTKQFIFGHWYISPYTDGVLMMPIAVHIPHPDPMQSMDFIGYQCEECKRKFISYDLSGLHHECTGVID